MNASSPQTSEWTGQHEALVKYTGLVDLGHRTQIEIGGDDRASFLHNLCTNEIRKLTAGAGCEMFLTSVQGKTLAHGFVFAGADSLLMETVGGRSRETILKHLDHYLVCERVTLADRSRQWSELFLAGPSSGRLLRELAGVELGEGRLTNATISLAGKSVWLRRADLVGPEGFLISGPSEDLPAVRTAVERAGAANCSQAAFEAARIEWGFPLFGADISDKNLPQEVARDRQAISFVKGCYLGQETVARIDALGHVNKMLAAIRFEGQIAPQIGTQLTADGQAVGQVTSVAYSPRLGRPLALGYLRRGTSAPATRLDSDVGAAEVVALPIR